MPDAAAVSAPSLSPLPAAVRIHPDDDVLVALRPLAAGERVCVEGIEVLASEPVEAGHKLALRPIAAGGKVRRYGWPIGHATCDVAAGALVHSHNLATDLAGEEPYAYAPGPAAAPSAAQRSRSFEGYARADGTVGVRNQLWVLPTVGCVARTAQRAAAAANARHGGRLDGVFAFGHPYGCSQLGEDLEGTARVLASLACHPNAGGVLLIGLGCESNQLGALLERIPKARRDRIRTVRAQASEDEERDAARALDELAELAAGDRRRTVGLGALALGLKCGGSDGLSGITANPLIGHCADAVTAAGGSAILTEIPEIFGAERLLMARAADETVFLELVELVNAFKRYFLEHGETVSENPSPGNIAGGITTLEEKSLGAVQKGGRATVAGVLRYGERRRGPGLAVLESPGNDAVSTTALAAAGATLTLFSTGRGTPLGSPVPTLKLATNRALAMRKPGWIDFDASAVLEEGQDAVAERLLDRICAVAGGEPARNELNDEREISLWKRGVTL
jgi:altronate hydrolase